MSSTSSPENKSDPTSTANNQSTFSCSLPVIVCERDNEVSIKKSTSGVQVEQMNMQSTIRDIVMRMRPLVIF